MTVGGRSASLRFEWSVRALAQDAAVQATLFPSYVCVADELALEFDECLRAMNDTLDVGRPNGGFSIAGQEICKTSEGHARFGHLLNEHGLFPDEEVMNAYLTDRQRRVDVEGLEHLDESIAMRIRILRRGGLRPG